MLSIKQRSSILSRYAKRLKSGSGKCHAKSIKCFLFCIRINQLSLSRREHNGHPPEILIDLNECHHMLVLNDQIGVILGGHYDRYNKMMRHFLEQIHKTGATLLFFMLGRQHSDDLPYFIPKAEESYIESLKILDKINHTSNLTGFLQTKTHLNANARIELLFDYNLKKLVSGFGDFHITYEQHQQEIAHYAMQNADKVLALITDDTKFMTFSGSYQFWRAKSMNFKKLTCNRYNRNRLYDKFGFEHGAVQMQLVSALCDSIYLPANATRDFFGGLSNANKNRQQSEQIWNISAYVKRQPLTRIGAKMIYDLEQISRDVFGDDYSQEELNAISNGLAFYNLNFEQSQDHHSNTLFGRVKPHNSFAYKLAKDPVFIVKDISYMDFRNRQFKNYAELVIPILMKLCGILFKDYPRRPKKRKICMKRAHDEPSKVAEEVIVYPTSK